MSEAVPPLPSRPEQPRRRGFFKLLVGVAVVAAGWLVFSHSTLWKHSDAHHRQVLERIHARVERAEEEFHRPTGNGSFTAIVPASKSELARYEIFRAVRTALANWPFYYQENCLPDKVAAIADWLDANNGADLKTFEGCCQLLVRCDEASWQFYDYPWITQLKEMEADGTIPKLPPLGKRWENDPRRKAAEANAKK